MDSSCLETAGASLIHNPSFMERGISDRAVQISVPDDLFGSRHNNIFGQAHAGKRFPYLNGQIPLGSGDRHDHEDIDVAIGARVPSRVRAKQNNLFRMEPFDDAPDRLADDFLSSLMQQDQTYIGWTCRTSLETDFSAIPTRC